MEQLLHSMPLVAVTRRCSEEIQNHYHGLQSDEQFCLEIFRRALIEGNNDAWAALREQFQPNILYWLRRHTRWREALEVELEQNYVDDTFSRLWQWQHNQQAKLNYPGEFNSQTGFNSLPGALRFLHDCLHSLIVDKLRMQARQQAVPIRATDFPIPSTGEAHVLRQELWSKIHATLSGTKDDTKEFRIIFLVYHEGLKPRQIIQLCPDEFNDINEVRRLMRNAMDRLRRHDVTLRVQLGYDDPE